MDKYPYNIRIMNKREIWFQHWSK